MCSKMKLINFAMQQESQSQTFVDKTPLNSSHPPSIMYQFFSKSFSLKLFYTFDEFLSNDCITSNKKRMSDSSFFCLD